MKFSYTNTPSQHRAGLVSIGHTVRKNMVIPPNAENYTISSICTGSCTMAVSWPVNSSQIPIAYGNRMFSSSCSMAAKAQCLCIWNQNGQLTNLACVCLLVSWLQMFPPEGITVFGSLLHTHLVGKNPSIFIMIIQWHCLQYSRILLFFCNTLHFTLLCYSILNWTLETSQDMD